MYSRQIRSGICHIGQVLLDQCRTVYGFCRAAGIRCEEAPVSRYFRPGMCDGAFLTEEYTYDAKILQKYYEEKLSGYRNVAMVFEARIQIIRKCGGSFEVFLEDGSFYEAPFVLNASYASVNQVIDKTEGLEKAFFDIKYRALRDHTLRALGPASGNRDYGDGRSLFLDYALWKDGPAFPDLRDLYAPHDIL